MADVFLPSVLALTPVRFSLRSFFRWVLRSLLRRFSDDQDDLLTYDEINADWDVRELERQHTCQHLERCLGHGISPN